MKVYFGVEEYQKVANPVVTTGTFDGVHFGHRTIINRLREIADKEQGETVLLTFHPHPRLVLFPDDSGLKLLNSLEEKIKLLDEAGIDHLIVHPFTKEFSRLTSIEYVRDILVNAIGTKKLVIGYNHHFGRNREGSFEHLKECGPLYGFEVEEIPAQDIDEVNVSSTKIRKALTEGNIEVANNYLGYNYRLIGKVGTGNQRGRTIGYPTANLNIVNQHKLIPANGVYAVIVRIDETEYKGMMNIGVRPTVQEKDQRTIEVHMFDFNENIYDKEIAVEFKVRLRDERKFESMEQLKAQLQVDKNKSLSLLV